MKRTFIILTILSLISKATGFLREIVLSYFYGANKITDIYLMAVSSGGIFLGWISTLAITHTSLYQEIRIKKNKKKAEIFTNQTLLIALVLGLICVFITSLYGEVLISIVAPGFSKQMIAVTAVFFRWTALSTVMVSLSQVCISEMNCKKNFAKANLTNITLSVIQMVVILISGLNDNNMILKLAMPISSFSQLVLLLIMLNKTKRVSRLSLPLLPEIKRLIILTAPIFASTLMDDMNALVDKMFASELKTGAISALNYAHLVKQLFFYIFATAMSTIIYPKLSEYFANENKEGFGKSINKGIEFMIIIFTFLMFIIVTFSYPIVEIIYKRGAFDNNAVILTAQALRMYALALLPLAIREILIRSFQAMQNTKINFGISIISTMLNICLNCILIRYLGHMGLALSTSLSAFVTVPILYNLLYKKNGFLNKKETIILGLKVIFCGGFAAGTSYWIYLTIPIGASGMFGKVLYMIFSIGAGLGVYIAGLLLFKVKVIKELFLQVKAGLNNKNTNR